jgi:regulator of sigma E protease
MQILETLFYFVVTLGVLVFVHEFGHFIAAKLTGMRVDRFSIGFPPRAFGKKIGETDYCVSWIPIGGYVKIAGMIDESFDIEFLERPPESHEFRAKPIWQRMIVISAGVLMNLLLAVLIFWGINYVQGRTVRETTEVGYVTEKGPAANSGFHEGDKISSINGRPVSNWEDILSEMFLESVGSDVTVTILRNGQEQQLLVRHSDLMDPNPAVFGMLPAYTDIAVGVVEPGMPADRLGLKPLDVFKSLDGTPIRESEKVREIVRAHAGKPLTVEWKRGDELMSGTTTPTADGKIGISFGVRYYGPTTSVRYSFLEAFAKGCRDLSGLTVMLFRQVGQMITGKIAFSQSVGGPIKIAQMATQSAEMGLTAYFGFMAVLSISLAFLNILPFPALDGGHLFFLIYEAIFRREIPVKVKLGLQKAGFVLLLAFMAFVLYNDIVHF